MPFNKDIGSSTAYQAAKPENWQPGDYTKFGSNKDNQEDCKIFCK
jgi:hypothetical protein